ncbi:ParB/RepB/Spo0J family partition protein [Halococcus saccharolyticus]|uniref:Chromosome segregation DNA-binding protein n=1 Tax=Halococcus saccharolyticus DSM 5350 TaxID=1227455 RepID=M0MQE4_9EURY|nr:ParB/RepB/Spo0J family partition protein [Halococcus saccharolyticus]EMA47947.1 chromosome segregation DNA-binding protein [Halococcus saccharolyticus DSM 5350]
MTENQYREVDPYEVAVSDMNERRSSPVTSSIQESIEKQGVIQPPLVRERDGMDDAEVPYEAVVGQRRVLGAQAAGGVETIPVVVVGWDDAEALEASITENIDVFREDVLPEDRATAILRLMDKQNYNQRQAAEALGVGRKVVTRMIERGREEWEGTALHPEHDNSTSTSPTKGQTEKTVDNLDDNSVREIRKMTGGGSEGEEIATKAVQDGLNQHDLNEAKKRVDRGQDPHGAVESVTREKQEIQETKAEERTRIELTFSGDESEALTTAAKQRGATENQVARQEIVRYLEAEGFL